MDLFVRDIVGRAVCASLKTERGASLSRKNSGSMIPDFQFRLKMLGIMIYARRKEKERLFPDSTIMAAINARVASRHGQNIQLTHCARKAARGFVSRRDAETQSYCARKAAPPFFRAPSPRSPHLCVFPTDKDWDNWDGWDFRGSFHVPLPHRTPKNRDKGEGCIHVVKKVEKCYSFLIYR